MKVLNQMKNHHIGLIIGASLLFGSAAMADTVDLAYMGVNTTYTASGSYAGGSYNSYVGAYNIRVNNGDTFASFCIDIYDLSGTKEQNYTYNVTPLADAPQSGGDSNTQMGEPGALAVRKLWDMYYQAATSDLKTAAALQVAIWEVVNEKGSGSYSLTGGSFTATGGNFVNTSATGELADIAQEMLDSIASHNPADLPNLFAYVNTFDNTHYQDFIGVPDGGVTLALLGISMGGLVFFARRKES